MFCRLLIKRILLAIGNLIIWAPLMGFIDWLAVDAILVAIMTVKVLEWATVKAIYYQPQPRTNDLLLMN